MTAVRVLRCGENISKRNQTGTPVVLQDMVCCPSVSPDVCHYVLQALRSGEDIAKDCVCLSVCVMTPGKCSGVVRTLLEGNQTGTIVAIAAASLIGAPALEELVYRGFLLPSLTKWMHTPAAVSVTLNMYQIRLFRNPHALVCRALQTVAQLYHAAHMPPPFSPPPVCPHPQFTFDKYQRSIPSTVLHHSARCLLQLLPL